MKNIALLLLTILSLSTLNCNKKCTATENTICNETVPEGEACAAYFEKWFYNKSSNKCEYKTYSGCSSKGFATLSECETCKCK